MLIPRLLTALALIPLVVWAVLQWSNPALAAIFAGLVLAGAWEWFDLAGFSGLRARWGSLFLLSVLLMGAWLTRELLAVPVLGGAVLFWLAAFQMLRCPVQRLAPVPNVPRLLMGAVVLIPAWLAMALIHAIPVHGPQLLLFFLVSIWLADSAAYFCGRACGRNRLAPSISPGKTWEGAFAGVGAVLLWSLAGSRWFGLSWSDTLLWVLLMLGVAVGSILADLFESLMKRQRGVKDSGQLLPGHGGVLDRVDSVLGTAPWFALGCLWLWGQG